jgi:hypothetical protein
VKGPKDDGRRGQSIEAVGLVLSVKVPLAVGHAGIDFFDAAALVDQIATESIAVVAAILEAEYQAQALVVGQGLSLGPEGAMASSRVVKGFVKVTTQAMNA